MGSEEATASIDALAEIDVSETVAVDTVAEANATAECVLHAL